MNEEHARAFLASAPDDVRRAAEGAPLTRMNLGRSGDTVCRVGKDRFLKHREDAGRLRLEKDRCLFLEGRVRAPRVLEYGENEHGAWLLTDRVPGSSSCLNPWIGRPESLTDTLAEAMLALHAVPAEDCPFAADDAERSPEGSALCLVHGDFCLPNIMIARGKFSGFVDVGGCGLGDPWIDVAWCLWSLVYNLKTDRYNTRLLGALGIPMDEARYRLYTE